MKSPADSAAQESRDAVRRRLAEAAAGQYEVLGELGRGGMGLVFLAKDVRLGRQVALKVLPPVDALRATSLERFRREAENAAGLTHPHIVPVYGVGGDAETPFIAMALIEGETLADRLERGALPPAEALAVARDVGGALAYAHRRGIIHRDLKPSNVLLERETGRALLSDFGLARSGTSDGLTQSGFALGTPGYMAPEQAGGQTADARSDVYAFGILLFEMCTGRRFETLDGGEWPVRSTSVRRVVRETPGVDAVVCDAIVKATAHRREDRFQSVDEMLAALPAGPFASRGAMPVRRPRARLAWYALALVAVLALGRLLWLVTQRGVAPSSASAGGGAAGIALMPFAGDAAAAAALIPMLRYGLEGFSAVRVADPRVFAPPAAADPASDEVRALAQRAGATWILYGFISPAGTGREVRLRGIDVRSGRPEDIGRAVVADISVGAADTLLLLLSRSSVGRDLGLTARTGDAPVSLEAVRAFSEAEEAFRRADYRAAVRGYERVSTLDTGFALARYKRFLAALQDEPTEAALREAVAEVRRAVPRVGPLERRLLTAYLVLFDSGNVVRAERQLAQLVADDSTFLDGWVGLAEVRYHFGALAGLPPDSAEAAFRRALALWPGAAPAIMHLVALDVYAEREDSARAHIAQYLALDSTSAIGLTLALGREVLYGSLADKRAVQARLPRLPERVLEIGAITGAVVARDRTDLTFTRISLEEMTTRERSTATRRQGARFLVLSYITEGRWSEAEREADRLQAGLPGDAELAQVPRLIRELRGAEPAIRDTAREMARLEGELLDLDVPHVPFGMLASRWPARWRLARLALARRDTATALNYLAAQDFLAAFSDQAVRGPAFLMKGRILAARGDRETALRYLRRSANLLTYAEPPWDAVRDSARAEIQRLGGVP